MDRRGRASLAPPLDPPLQCSTQHLIQPNFEVDIKSHFALSIMHVVNTSVSVSVDSSVVFFTPNVYLEQMLITFIYSTTTNGK